MQTARRMQPESVPAMTGVAFVGRASEDGDGLGEDIRSAGKARIRTALRLPIRALTLVPCAAGGDGGGQHGVEDVAEDGGKRVVRALGIALGRLLHQLGTLTMYLSVIYLRANVIFILFSPSSL
jgi:hypothetical protein